MGLVLIGTGISLFIAKINNKAVFDTVVKWWPLVFVLLGIEVLILSCRGKDNTPVKYDLFSIFIILLIVFCGLGLYGLESIGVTAKIDNYLTSQEYHIKSSTIETAIAPDINKLVINAPFCDLKIQACESTKINSYIYALAKADSQQAAQNLVDKGVQVESTTSGKTQYLSFKLPETNGVHTTEYTLFIPQNIDVEVHDGNTVQIYADKLDNNWKIAGSGDLQIFLPRQADLTIRAAVDENTSLGGTVTWEETGTTENKSDSNDEKKLAQVKLGTGTHSMDIIWDSGSRVSVNQL